MTVQNWGPNFATVHFVVGFSLSLSKWEVCRDIDLPSACWGNPRRVAWQSGVHSSGCPALRRSLRSSRATPPLWVPAVSCPESTPAGRDERRRNPALQTKFAHERDVGLRFPWMCRIPHALRRCTRDMLPLILSSSYSQIQRPRMSFSGSRASRGFLSNCSIRLFAFVYLFVSFSQYIKHWTRVPAESIENGLPFFLSLGFTVLTVEPRTIVQGTVDWDTRFDVVGILVCDNEKCFV